MLPDYPAPQDTPWRRYAGSVAPPRDGRPRVVLVTLCDAALADLCDASMDNKRAYAARHGALSLLARHLATIHLTSCTCHSGYELLVANDMIDPSRPAAWSKIIAVRAAFDRGAELVACLDADTLIMNPLVRLEELFDWRFEQLLGADHNGPNSGVWLIRRSEWSVAFLEALWHEGTRYVSMAPLRSIFRYEQRAFHYLFQSAAWRRRIGDRYEGANGVRVRTKLVHQCVLNSLPSFYTPGDFVLHLAGIKGAVKCLMFRRHYLAAAAAAGLTPGVDAVRPSSPMRCLCGSPIAG